MLQPKPRNKLRGALIALDLTTLDKMAKEIGMSKGVIQQVLAGRLFPSSKFQILCAKTLGISVKDLEKLM